MKIFVNIFTFLQSPLLGLCYTCKFRHSASPNEEMTDLNAKSVLQRNNSRGPSYLPNVNGKIFYPKSQIIAK